jgi:hypothetical protein
MPKRLSGSAAWQMALPGRPFATRILLNRKKLPIYKYKVLVPKKLSGNSAWHPDEVWENDK